MSLSLSLTNNMRLTRGAASIPSSLAIINSQNMTVASQADGSYLVTKTSPDNYDGSVILGAAEILNGDFVIVVEPSNLATHMQAGLDATVNGNHSNTTIDYAMLLNGSNTSVYDVQSGTTTQGPTAYGGSTVFFYRRVGSTVTILKGADHDVDAATVVFTVAGVGTGNFYFATTFYEQNAEWKLRVYEL